VLAILCLILQMNVSIVFISFELLIINIVCNSKRSLLIGRLLCFLPSSVSAACWFVAAGPALSSGSGVRWWSQRKCGKRCADIPACILYKTELSVSNRHWKFITTM
jgi:hypothetical protein